MKRRLNRRRAIEWAPDGLIGLDSATREAHDLIILDLALPRMSGIDLCRNIRSTAPNLPFFLVTGRQMELSTTTIADELNIQHVFGKPFSPNDVIAAVNTAIQDSSAAC